MARLLTTGLIPLPTDAPTSLEILVGNPGAETASVPFRILAQGAEGAKLVVREGVFTIPPGEAERLRLVPDEVQGRTVQVDVEGQPREVEPSVTVLQTFAQEALNVTQWVGPAGFATVDRAEGPDHGAGDGGGAPFLPLTTGLIPVDRPGRDPEPSWMYQLHVLVTDVTGGGAAVPFSVEEARELWGLAVPLQDGLLEVPAGGAAAAVVEGVEGRWLLANLDLPTPGLVPTVALTRTLAGDRAVRQLVLWIGPQRFVRREGAPLRTGEGSPATLRGDGRWPRGM